MKRNAATERQVQSADPGNSTWLSANAGSGKTRVLTDRVARLLLEGVQPQHILCLTYTKAAASEMQNRLFRRLGAWAMLEDGHLTASLEELGLDGRVDQDRLLNARRLFARAIETPGGLKIQTIHSFCAGLLRRFPLEAGVSPQFVEMDERAAQLMREEIVEDMADGDGMAAVDGLAAWFTGAELDSLIGEIVKHRDLFSTAADPAGLWAHFDMVPGYGADDLKSQVFLGNEADLLTRLVAVLKTGSANDLKAAAKLANVTAGAPSSYAILESVFLTGASAKEPFTAKLGSFPTKKTQAALGLDLDAVQDFMRRVEDSRPRRLALMAAEKTLALHQFATVFLPEYEERKLRNGWLDFDDLIGKARELLTDTGVAEWVLYRLDGGIDHILVDEAQDTSPLQWQVIDLLSREFTTGEGARDVPRTIFVVGDTKQSIYSFQGADPEGFDRMRQHFRHRLEDVDIGLEDLQLEYSFRSSSAILRVVDDTFPPGARKGLGDTVSHIAFRDTMPGRVDLWPVIDKAESPERPHWTDPVDTPSPEHHAVRLAERIAGEIRAMIDRGDTLWQSDGSRKPISCGDILILVQRRSDLFHEIIRACKSAGLDVAGADRLKIGGELAVRDLKALLSFLALPEDSLSLAEALRSPLFGWNEAALYDLAANRTEKHLWAALRNRFSAETEPFLTLGALLKDADFLRPYDLLERILIRHDGRRKLIARLGEEAEDGIDALLSQALAYEQMDTPSLTGFISWLDAGEVEIKRQLDSASDRIRVMTVHGAKGLEAPVVILPDTGKRQIRIDAEVVDTGGIPAWCPPSAESPDIIRQAKDAARTRQEEERQRLLYVAMTRAEQWLIICAAGDLDKGQSWYERIQAGLTRSGADEHAFGFGKGLRHEVGKWGGVATTSPDSTPIPAPAVLPDWTTARADTPERVKSSVAATSLGGAKALGGAAAMLDEDAAMLRGSQIHLLLEHLPDVDPADRSEAGHRLLMASWPDLTDPHPLLDEALTVLNAPHLADIFSPGALVEVDLSAALPELGGKRLHGTIDRLIVSEDRLLAVDFKSNAVVPKRPEDTPEGILRQMGAYASALSLIYPARDVEVAVLWTADASVMLLPQPLIADALGRGATT